MNTEKEHVKREIYASKYSNSNIKSRDKFWNNFSWQEQTLTMLSYNWNLLNTKEMSSGTKIIDHPPTHTHTHTHNGHWK
jgi:hypothetical protein